MRNPKTKWLKVLTGGQVAFHVLAAVFALGIAGCGVAELGHEAEFQEDNGQELSGPTLTVRSRDLDNGNNLFTGMYTQIAQNGSVLQSGYTTFSKQLRSGTYSVTVHDYQNLLFDRWDNGSTSRTRTVSISSSTTLTAYYRTKSTPSTYTLSVNAIDLDDNNRQLGMYTTVEQSGSDPVTGFTPLSLTLAAGTHTVTVSNYNNLVFERWSDGVTTASRSVSLSSNVSLTAHYRSKTTSSPEPEPTSPPSSNTGSLTAVSYSASSENFLNPERGFYDHVNLLGTSGFGFVRTNGRTIAMASIRLDNYRTADLPTSLLDSMKAGLDRVRAARIKIILRFSYNSCMNCPDASKSQILRHISQIKPLLQSYADVIVVFQAGYIGSWGEWHSSTNGLDNPTDRKDILTAMLNALPPSRMVAVRTPRYKWESFGDPLSSTEAFTQTHRARISHYNDCYLASSTDYGTYTGYNQTIEHWKRYVSDDTRYVAHGGETCAVYAPLTDCSPAQAEMARMRTSYLNSAYNQTVINGWSSQGCLGNIQKALGYRFELLRTDHTSSVAPGGELGLSVLLRNRGYAALFNERPVYVVLSNSTGSVRLAAKLSKAGSDPRRWLPGSDVTLSTRLRIPANLAQGTYRLSLWLPDAASNLRDLPEYAIRFANSNIWDAARGENLLTGQLSISTSASGTVDSSATQFVEL